MFSLLDIYLQKAICEPQRTNYTHQGSGFYKDLVGTIVPAQVVLKKEMNVPITLPAPGMETTNSNGMVGLLHTVQTGRRETENGNVFFDRYCT